MNVWEYTATVPKNAKATHDLWYWSLNYDPGMGPFSIFLDLINFGEEYGGRFSRRDSDDLGMGYVELDYLGSALTEYASDPTAVTNWITGLFDAEMEG